VLRVGFHGAAGTVTGSRHLVETGVARILVDCGQFQGEKRWRLKNWDPLPFDPASLDAVLLTHAHIDHSGMLPRLVRDGYRGSIYTTPATADLAEILLLDSARLAEEDAEHANRKGYSKHRPALPLFTEEDAESALRRFRRQPYGAILDLPGARVVFHNAGHICTVTPSACHHATPWSSSPPMATAITTMPRCPTSSQMRSWTR
jgi:metallo-beta-lactamase family protein